MKIFKETEWVSSLKELLGDYGYIKNIPGLGEVYISDKTSLWYGGWDESWKDKIKKGGNVLEYCLPYQDQQSWEKIYPRIVWEYIDGKIVVYVEEEREDID